MRAAVCDRPALVTELITCLRAADLRAEAWGTVVEHLDDLSMYTLQTLVEERRGTHPGSTVLPYRNLVDLYLADTGNKYRYRHAARHLKALRDIHRGLGAEPEFLLYLEELRTVARPAFSPSSGLGGTHPE
ncbi:hypothetical protein [Streptomyces sp. AcE210]|uniref:hypothetical protein n=1 Tax=Streptomyces sp. AcE210 TaxID=2292703 RepID=UPI000E305B3A|nr:hypothetical protein [Streptomyces sp. AcE210]RFC70983.1 hypothetical protein DXZ75_27730 [Streptomyces sp. AcE210]